MTPFLRVELGGKKVGTMIVRDAQTETLAARFISLGGRYVIEDHFGGKVRLIATIPHKQKTLEVRSLTVANGPELPPAIDQLIPAV